MMNKEEVVRLFVKSGFQLSNSALEITMETPNQIIKELKKIKPRPFIITEKHVKKIISKIEKTTIKPKILKEFVFKKKPITVRDYVKHFLFRYEKMKNMISEHIPKEKLISINKITPQLSKFSVIGFVREKTENKIILEDPTGEAQIFFKDELKQKFENIILDDIIGVLCKKIKGKIFAINIIYPDISYTRKINKTKNDSILVVLNRLSDLNSSNYKKLLDFLSSIKNLCLVLVFGGLSHQLNDMSRFNFMNIKNDSNPILYQFENIKILIIPKGFIFDYFKKMNPIDIMSFFLKRRHLSPNFNLKIHTNGNNFILDEIPDILISNSDISSYKNYKGTTIISNNNPRKIYIINLKTREVVEETI